ncbi:MAG: YkgJ family cysteine cluster protein [Desulfopila sp.]|jgi:Fe-S-cluster containining protein|nr:YkgJ family cysteine cluster protein [Desulfopila sp.]
MEKTFPQGLEPLGDAPFRFACHEKVACFTRCCKMVEMQLFPYDVIRLKNSIGIDSQQFMHKFTRVVRGANPYFPSVMMKLNESSECPFLNKNGCSVYADRPSACRTYPLERAVDRSPVPGKRHDFYFLTSHDYCLGHDENHYQTVSQWVRKQRIEQHNLMNDLWSELDTLFASNPWKGEGSGGEKERFAFMVCYDIDGLRQFVDNNNVLRQFRLGKDQKKGILTDDSELLKFGFEWLKFILTGKSSLLRR